MFYITWLNRTDLVCIRSLDNGTTWSDPITIFNSTVMGAKNSLDIYTAPRMDVAILKNGTILIVSECDDAQYTDLVFVQSDNNGTEGSWIAPQNVTCAVDVFGFNPEANVPKIQVNRSSGVYWLMWNAYRQGAGTYRNDTKRWAQFQPNQSPYTNVQTKNVTDNDLRGSFDFYYDHHNEKIRLIRLSSPYGIQIENWTCTNFNDNDWTRTILGEYSDLGAIDSTSRYINYIYSDNKNNILYRAQYLGNTEIFRYTVLPESIFFIRKGLFDADQLVQVRWKGRKFDGSPIETSLAKVLFRENYTNEVGEVELFIIIDNYNPSIKEFQQNRQYFNPLSSNITLTEIPWEILPSESCDAYLEVFSQDIGISEWNQILENNWDDRQPKIFYSYRGILYVAYNSFESGRDIIYLIKSYDKGITWSDPIKIYESTHQIAESGFQCAAWGDTVCILVHKTNEERLLFRSFDQGSTFQDPINIYDANLFDDDAKLVSDMVFTKNGTIFITYRNDTTQFYIIRSGDLGINWTVSNIFPGNNSWSTDSGEPFLAYDPENDLVHFAMTLDKTLSLESRIVNLSIARLNVSINQWSTLESLNLIEGSFFTQFFNFIITKDNKTATPKTKITFLGNLTIPDITFTIKEFVSYDLGDNWGSMTVSDTDFFQSVCTNLAEIFYIRAESDGNDEELFIKREGRLVKTDSFSLSTFFSSEITFDGIDDFEAYIDEGNYTYVIRLEDYAGNSMEEIGWLFADYNAPQITDLSTSLGAPLPLYDLTIIVDVTDAINFTVYLHYKRDDGSWQKVQMHNNSEDSFSAVIPGETNINRIEYYVSAIDLAGNEYILDNDGSHYSYGMPNFVWSSEGLFKEDKDYSSSNSYTFTITISSDLEYVQDVIFRYSYDEGNDWDDLELEQSSPEFEGELDDIPGDLRELYYKIIIIDIYGNEYELTDTRKIEFYPEVPRPEVDVFWTNILIIISAIIGFLVAFGYIRLKNLSHEKIYQKILRREFIKKPKEPKEELEAEAEIIPLESTKIATPFTMTYLAVLCGTVLLFSLGILVAYITPAMGILILAGSLLLGVYGYMILMSRDITINVYLERIYTKNIILESFQMAFMFFNILMILIVGYSMDWFRYYLVESTFNFGDVSIPRLYLSVIGVFFTSLVLVIITTYVQLRKIVVNILKQKSQGASENMLLYLKDQNSSRMITHTGYKTIVFLVTVLLAIVTTTNLLTNETGVLLIIVLLPFAFSGLLALIIHRLIERKKIKKEKEHMEMLFVDSKKICTKCGESAYLSNKFCGSCGAQLIFEDMMGTYVSRCTECNALLDENAKHCTECGKEVQQKSIIKKNNK